MINPFPAEDLRVQCKRRRDNRRPKGFLIFFPLEYHRHTLSCEWKKMICVFKYINKLCLINGEMLCNRMYSSYNGIHVFIKHSNHPYLHPLRLLWTTSVTLVMHPMPFSMWEQAGEKRMLRKVEFIFMSFL